MSNKQQNAVNITTTIIQAAQQYKEKLVGRSFLYFFEGRYIEVIYRTKDFLHLKGVDTNLSAGQFYKDALDGKLRPQQIFFSSRHPFDICNKKISKLMNLHMVVDSDIFILEDLTTQSFTYKFGLADLSLTVCLSKDTNQNGQVVSNHYIPRSLRVEDSFGRANDAFEVQYIFSKQNNERKYNIVTYADGKTEIKDLPAPVLDMLDVDLKNQ